MPIKILDRKEILSRFKSAHGESYDYSGFVYSGAFVKSEIRCKEHGIFMMSPRNHYMGQGCPKCRYLKMAISRVNSARESFQEKATKIHSDKYDYSLVEYVHNSKGVIIICKKHGKFIQSPSQHLSGYGCNLCGRGKTDKALYEKKVLSPEKALKLIAEKHKGSVFPKFFNEYKNGSSLITCLCKVHNYVTVRKAITLFRQKYCCSICSPVAVLTISKLEKILPSMYAGKYGVSRIDGNVCTFICETHGEFIQDVHTFMSKYPGCPKCSGGSSLGEKEVIKFIEENYSGRILLKDRYLLKESNRELDIFLPEASIGIEFNGVYWHSFPRTYKQYHRDKRKSCESKGVRLIQIWEDEWIDSKEKIKSYLLSVLGKRDKKVYARSCKVSEISYHSAKQFLDDNHLQGYGIKCNNYIGLFDEGGNLVSVMSFKKGFNTSGVELQRFCTLPGVSVVGGFTRLISFWSKKNPGIKLISFIDLDKFDGHSYYLAGFKKYAERLSLKYVKNGKRLSRHIFKKHKLKSLKGYSDDRKEIDICMENGIYPIWNSGTLSLVLENS